jgi:hypothetical protein
VDRLYLVRNGVPFDVACNLGRSDRLAWVVALGTLSGRHFDWPSMTWDEEAA